VPLLCGYAQKRFKFSLSLHCSAVSKVQLQLAAHLHYCSQACHRLQAICFDGLWQCRCCVHNFSGFGSLQPHSSHLPTVKEL